MLFPSFLKYKTQSFQAVARVYNTLNYSPPITRSTSPAQPACMMRPAYYLFAAFGATNVLPTLCVALPSYLSAYDKACSSNLNSISSRLKNRPTLCHLNSVVKRSIEQDSPSDSDYLNEFEEVGSAEDLANLDNPDSRATGSPARGEATFREAKALLLPAEYEHYLVIWGRYKKYIRALYAVKRNKKKGITSTRELLAELQEEHAAFLEYIQYQGWLKAELIARGLARPEMIEQARKVGERTLRLKAKYHRDQARRKELEALKASGHASEADLQELAQLQVENKVRKQQVNAATKATWERRKTRQAELMARKKQRLATPAELQELADLDAVFDKRKATSRKNYHAKHEAREAEIEALTDKIAAGNGTNEDRRRLKELEDAVTAESAKNHEKYLRYAEKHKKTRQEQKEKNKARLAELTAKKEQGSANPDEVQELAEMEAKLATERAKKAAWGKSKREARRKEIEELTEKIAAGNGTDEDRRRLKELKDNVAEEYEKRRERYAKDPEKSLEGNKRNREKRKKKDKASKSSKNESPSEPEPDRQPESANPSPFQLKPVLPSRPRLSQQLSAVRNGWRDLGGILSVSATCLLKGMCLPTISAGAY